jgi:dihydroxyacetone kinase-like predicted kinase
MDEQTRQRAAEIPDDARPPVPLLDTFVTAVVAVANGPGLRDIFVESGMGASSVVQGGDSLNPSVGDLLKAVNAAPADAVVVLPNNPNIIGTARQLDDLTDKRVDVIPTSCMQEGIAALLAFSPDRDLALNVESILEAVEFICSASLTTATRDVELDGTLVKTGDKIGLLDGKVAAASDTHVEVARQLFRQPSVDGELVTIYRGEHSSEEEAAEIASIATQSLNSVEVEIVYGGQPHYPYLIAIE